jgi:hypothetical protein
MIHIPTLERKYIPYFRKTKVYKYLKFFCIVIPILPFYYGYLGIKLLISRVRIKRGHKPDIVLQNIIDGWTNLVLHDEASEELAMRRANICAKCPKAEYSTAVHTLVVDNKTKHIRGMKCGACGCPLSAKVRSKRDHCPLAKW